MENHVDLLLIVTSFVFMVASNILHKKNYELGTMIAAIVSTYLITNVAVNATTIVVIASVLTAAAGFLVASASAFIAEKEYKLFSVIYYTFLLINFITLFV